MNVRSDGMSRILNRRAHYDYTVKYDIEGGLELKGNEVKSIEEGMCALNGSWCRFIGGELFITGICIKPWSTSNSFDVDENRDVKVLLHKRELHKLSDEVKLKGYSIIPLEVYKSSSGKFKVKLGVCIGNKLYDKREINKTRQVKKTIERETKLNYM